MFRTLFQGISAIFAVGIILGLVLAVQSCPEKFPEVQEVSEWERQLDRIDELEYGIRNLEALADMLEGTEAKLEKIERDVLVLRERVCAARGGCSEISPE